MTKTKLIVTTDVGTFTRTTTRTYSHIVVVSGFRAGWLEARRRAEIARATKERDKYIAAQQPGYVDHDRYGDSHTRWVADGSYAKWVEGLNADLAQLEAIGQITEDSNSPYKHEEPTWRVLGWNGRLDLAQKLAATKQAEPYRDVRIYALDGTRVD